MVQRLHMFFGGELANPFRNLFETANDLDVSGVPDVGNIFAPEKLG